MGVKERMLAIIIQLDMFCSEYWQLITAVMFCTVAILVMTVIINGDNKHLK